jgi:hypothetical protein
MYKWFSGSRRRDLNWDVDKAKIRQLTMCEEHFAADQFMCPADKGDKRKLHRNLRHDAIPERVLNRHVTHVTQNSDAVVPDVTDHVCADEISDVIDYALDFQRQRCECSCYCNI